MKKGFSFDITARDKESAARTGVVQTPRGRIRTPAFMPVATHGAMKALTIRDVADADAEIILCNTYHLGNSPGAELVKKLGGLHAFTGWKGPILTDSGGFQVFSLPKKKVADDGVRFHHGSGDGTLMTPESSIQTQELLGADIIMAFDECVEYPCSKKRADDAARRTIEWAARCKDAHTRDDQLLFGIVQGSVFKDLRERCIKALARIGFDGYATGGVSVGEGFDNMRKILGWTAARLPAEAPHYLMGVGLPEDIVQSVAYGVDLFDCVIPTRYARSAVAFTFHGRMRLSAKKFRKDKYPVDTSCGCYACRNFSRAYLHHLFASNEILGAMLTSIHNIYFYQEMMRRAREAIAEKRYDTFMKQFLATYRSKKKRARAR